EEPEVPYFRVKLHDVSEESAHDPGGFDRNGAWGGHVDGVITEIREPQFAKKQAAIGVRIGAHAAGAAGGKLGNLGAGAAIIVEEFFGPIALHPLLEDAYIGSVLVHLPPRDLMRAPIILGALAVDLLWACPPLGRAEHDHGPAGPFREPVPSRFGLDALNFADDVIESGSHQLVHRFRLMPLDEVWCIAIATK